MPGRIVTNLKIGFENGRFGIDLWARNLLDERYASSAVRFNLPDKFPVFTTKPSLRLAGCWASPCGASTEGLVPGDAGPGMERLASQLILPGTGPGRGLCRGAKAMTETAELKRALLAEIEQVSPTGGYAEDRLDRIHALIGQLTKRTPLPRPIDDQQQVTGAWGTQFAQFGPKHTAGKPVAHETNFQLLTFNGLPKMPLRNLDIEQEITMSPRTTTTST